jgi:predicted nucleic acid-binding protein
VIFVDTSAWYAATSPRDVNHRAAIAFMQSVTEQMVTSDFVIDETLTLFRARGEDLHAIAFGEQLIDQQFAQVVNVLESDFLAAWSIFKTFSDKRWSFTDCTSRVLMERLGIAQAFAFDEHFRQFGTVTVVP